MLYNRWWANQGVQPDNEGLSLLDLVNSGTIDCKLGGLLWLLMERKSSMLVAAGPSWAGKSTLMHALLDFLPPELEQINLLGYYETFKFLDFSKPETSYLVTEEVSNHQYEYLWGVKAVRAFNLTVKGYPLGGTIHARTPEEVVTILNRYLGLQLPVLSRLGAIVTLQARNGRDYHDEPVRRVNSVSLVVPADEGLGIQMLAARNFEEKAFKYITESDMQAALSGKYPIGKHPVNIEIETRAHFLRHLRKRGQTSRAQVRNAVLGFYRTQQDGK